MYGIPIRYRIPAFRPSAISLPFFWADSATAPHIEHCAFKSNANRAKTKSISATFFILVRSYILRGYKQPFSPMIRGTIRSFLLCKAGLQFFGPWHYILLQDHRACLDSKHPSKSVRLGNIIHPDHVLFRF